MQWNLFGIFFVPSPIYSNILYILQINFAIIQISRTNVMQEMDLDINIIIMLKSSNVLDYDILFSLIHDLSNEH